MPAQPACVATPSAAHLPTPEASGGAIDEPSVSPHGECDGAEVGGKMSRAQGRRAGLAAWAALLILHDATRCSAEGAVLYSCVVAMAALMAFIGMQEEELLTYPLPAEFVREVLEQRRILVVHHPYLASQGFCLCAMLLVSLVMRVQREYEGVAYPLRDSCSGIIFITEVGNAGWLAICSWRQRAQADPSRTNIEKGGAGSVAEPEELPKPDSTTPPPRASSYNGVQARRAGFTTWAAILTFNDARILASMPGRGVSFVLVLSVFAPSCIVAFMAIQEEEMLSYPISRSLAPYVCKWQAAVTSQYSFLGTPTFCCLASLYILALMALRVAKPHCHSLDSLWQSCVILMTLNESFNALCLLWSCACARRRGDAEPRDSGPVEEEALTTRTTEEPPHQSAAAAATDAPPAPSQAEATPAAQIPTAAAAPAGEAQGWRAPPSSGGLQARKAGGAIWSAFFNLSDVRSLSRDEHINAALAVSAFLPACLVAIMGDQADDVLTHAQRIASYMRRQQAVLAQHCHRMQRQTVCTLARLQVLLMLRIRNGLAHRYQLDQLWRSCITPALTDTPALANKDASGVQLAKSGGIADAPSSANTEEAPPVSQYRGVQARRAGFAMWAAVLTFNELHILASMPDEYVRLAVVGSVLSLACILAVMTIQVDEVRCYPFGDTLSVRITELQAGVADRCKLFENSTFHACSSMYILLLMGLRVAKPYFNSLNALWQSCFYLMALNEVHNGLTLLISACLRVARDSHSGWRAEEPKTSGKPIASEVSSAQKSYSGLQARRAGFATWVAVLAANDTRMHFFSPHPEHRNVLLTLFCFVTSCLLAFMGIQEDEVRLYPCVRRCAPWVVRQQRALAGRWRCLASDRRFGCHASCAILLMLLIRIQSAHAQPLAALWRSCALLIFINEATNACWHMWRSVVPESRSQPEDAGEAAQGDAAGNPQAGAASTAGGVPPDSTSTPHAAPATKSGPSTAPGTNFQEKHTSAPTEPARDVSKSQAEGEVAAGSDGTPSQSAAVAATKQSYSGIQARRAGFATWAAVLTLNDARILASMPHEELRIAVTLSVSFPALLVALLGIQEAEVRAYPFGKALSPRIVEAQEALRRRCPCLGTGTFFACASLYTVALMSVRVNRPYFHSLDELWLSCTVLVAANEVTYALWLLWSYLAPGGSSDERGENLPAQSSLEEQARQVVPPPQESDRGGEPEKEEQEHTVASSSGGNAGELAKEADGDAVPALSSGPVASVQSRVRARRAGLATWAALLTANDVAILCAMPGEQVRILACMTVFVAACLLAFMGMQEHEVLAYPMGSEIAPKILQAQADLAESCSFLGYDSFTAVATIYVAVMMLARIQGAYFPAVDELWRACFFLILSNEFINAVWHFRRFLKGDYGGGGTAPKQQPAPSGGGQIDSPPAEELAPSAGECSSTYSGIQARRAGFAAWATFLTINDARILLSMRGSEPARVAVTLSVCFVACIVTVMGIQEEELRSYPLGSQLAPRVVQLQASVAERYPWLKGRAFCGAASLYIFLLMAVRVTRPYFHAFDSLWRSCTLLIFLNESTYALYYVGRSLCRLCRSQAAEPKG